MKIHNFSAGPAILPQSVMQQASEACIDINGSGLSILEISHRSPEFSEVIAEAEQLVRELLSIGDDYAVLFLTGGASSQFYMVPMNILNEDEKAAYINTGAWSTKAIKEAKAFGQIEEVASSKDKNFNYLPKRFDIPTGSKYLHITTNNTIYGTEFHKLPDTTVPIVADMSSDFLSRPVDLSRFDLIYAGAQKNLGPAGVTLVIVKKDIVGKVNRNIPTMLNYQTHIDKGSMFNTPPVFPIYVSMLTMRWIKEKGGLQGMATRNKTKADLIYNEIDRNSLFVGTASIEDRSLMNATFVMTKDGIDGEFMAMAKEHNISGIKGHRSIGGFRASIYNSMPIESVQVLVDVMKKFEEKYG